MENKAEELLKKFKRKKKKDFVFSAEIDCTEIQNPDIIIFPKNTKANSIFIIVDENADRMTAEVKCFSESNELIQKVSENFKVGIKNTKIKHGFISCFKEVSTLSKEETMLFEKRYFIKIPKSVNSIHVHQHFVNLEIYYFKGNFFGSTEDGRIYAENCVFSNAEITNHNGNVIFHCNMVNL